jgi:hypothetical protein
MVDSKLVYTLARFIVIICTLVVRRIESSQNKDRDYNGLYGMNPLMQKGLTHS